MEKERQVPYFMLFEDIPQLHHSKVKFCKFIKVLEFHTLKREKNATQQKITELRENAKKLEQIDGGLKPSRNIYKAHIDSFGTLTDLRSGKTLKIPNNKFSLIVNQFSCKRSLPAKAKSLLIRIGVAPEVRSSMSNRATLRFPSLNRVKRRF